MMQEKNKVSPNTIAASTSNSVQEENIDKKFESILNFLDEPGAAKPDDEHAIPAECEIINGVPLSERLKRMTEEQRNNVMKKIEAIKKYKSKYEENMRSIENYSKKIDEQKRENTRIKEEAQMYSEANKRKQAEYNAVQVKHQEAEREMENFKQDSKAKIKYSDEIKRLKREKTMAEKSIREQTRTLSVCKKRLLNKSEDEKQVKEVFEHHLNLIKQYREKLNVTNIIERHELEELDCNIIDWTILLDSLNKTCVDINTLPNGQEDQ